ncbi:MAG: tetrathionate reductase family octaheme c-type cytochrome [Desulfuromonadales bacterium]|nr:tetrathionate reductase family octaheme c-type cytochrome [Desulfuromonadales bacterium]MBN2791955.1 tetrathionate reductase family octaheme c-type cytochrome [Desulfuromonadales bacterium]
MRKLSGKLVISTLAMALLWSAPASAIKHSFHNGILQGPFESGPQVTKACLECHKDAAFEVMKTTHWTWETEQIVNGKLVKRGKKNVMNNFCGAVKSNEPRCTSCHVGYGWADDSFDFSDPTKVDCLVCHDTTGTYKKPSAGAGHPAGYTGKAKFDKKPVDLTYVARNVGAPNRDNCLICHANGGGGNNIKHGDIDTSLINPTKEVDFHMGTDSLDFSCQECHITTAHDISGSSLIVSPNNVEPVTCEQCHDSAPHAESILNNHTATVACQTCHIPAFAKVHATKMSWDWSASEKGTEVEKDEHGHEIFLPHKGRFTYQDNVIPEYRWYNGKAGAYNFGDKIDPSKPTKLNYPLGNITDKNSKIMPFKVHTGKQAYDTTNKYFVTPKVWGPEGDPEAYWVNYKKVGAAKAWPVAAAAGMKANGLEFSGNIGFAPTESYWAINHMVAEADKALDCLDCHGDGGRMNWKELGYKADPMKDRTAARR